MQINELHPESIRVRLASELLHQRRMWKRALQAVADHVPPSSEPWYRRADVWLLLGAIVLPFGWILAVARIAWAKAMAHRERRRAARAFASSLSSPERNQSA